MQNKFGFILVKPQLGENIGACARSMKNFGFNKLHIIKPKINFPNHKAKATSVGAYDIINKAKVFDNMEINIPSLIKTLQVNGNIYNPGVLDITNTRFTVASAIEASGGLREDTRRRGIIVTKVNGVSYKPSFLQKQVKKLDYGDIVFVPKKDESLELNQFFSDLSTTLANLLTIFVVIDRVNSD